LSLVFEMEIKCIMMMMMLFVWYHIQSICYIVTKIQNGCQ